VSNLINYQYLGFTIDPAKYPKLKKYADGVVKHDPFKQALAREAPMVALDSSLVS
jgi:hypothetical protein